MSVERETKCKLRCFLIAGLVVGSVWWSTAVLADPPPSEEGEIEIEMDGLFGGGESDRSRAVALAALCQLAAKDDHGDFEPCATWLAPGHELIASLGDRIGSDRDLFTFRLGEPGDGRRHSVELALAAELELDLRLRAANGGPVPLETPPGMAESTPWVRWFGLSSGLYYLEVTSGDGNTGLYALRLDVVRE